MCGILGFWGSGLSSLDDAIKCMSAALHHRGPDASGVWIDKQVGLGLGHRRLAIQDLSPQGAQPMHSSCGRYVIAFNGEIYNHLELRKKMSANGVGVLWRGHSDTETILECFSRWGIEETLKIMVGMFSIALWDKKDRVLTLARDRMGEKPLYWGWNNNKLYFASELNSIKSHPDFVPSIDRGAIALLLRHNCIPAPYSIYQGIQKLPPASFISLSLNDKVTALSAKPVKYWNFDQIVESGNSQLLNLSDEDAADELEDLLVRSVKGQALSDVPIGALLSGGYDSSLVTALLQSVTTSPVNTFTIGFNDAAYNEAGHAKSIAKYLGTNHTELYVTPKDALDIIPSLPSIYCEPFSDSSQIPTFLVSKLASSHVKVCLGGDGGDELFGGYNRYLLAKKVWSRLSMLPRSLRGILSRFLTSFPPHQWDYVFQLFSGRYPLATPGDKIHKLASVLDVTDEKGFYRSLTSHWANPSSIVLNSYEPKTLVSDGGSWPNVDCFEHAMMAMDAQTYMPDDILVKVDRAAMANSLETRSPLIDHRVVEYAWKLPLRMKIRDGNGKWLLRKVLYRHIPQSLLDRPKMGFGVPIHDWLRGPLRDWAESLLSYQRLENEGYFDASQVRLLWDQHLSGKKNNQHLLWDVLMFQGWLDEQ